MRLWGKFNKGLKGGSMSGTITKITIDPILLKGRILWIHDSIGDGSVLDTEEGEVTGGMKSQKLLKWQTAMSSKRNSLCNLSTLSIRQKKIGGDA
jgi:hypothetical protein